MQKFFTFFIILISVLTLSSCDKGGSSVSDKEPISNQDISVWKIGIPAEGASNIKSNPFKSNAISLDNKLLLRIKNSFFKIYIMFDEKVAHICDENQTEDQSDDQSDDQSKNKVFCPTTKEDNNQLNLDSAEPFSITQGILKNVLENINQYIYNGESEVEKTAIERFILPSITMDFPDNLKYYYCKTEKNEKTNFYESDVYVIRTQSAQKFTIISKDDFDISNATISGTDFKIFVKAFEKSEIESYVSTNQCHEVNDNGEVKYFTFLKSILQSSEIIEESGRISTTEEIEKQREYYNSLFNDENNETVGASSIPESNTTSVKLNRVDVSKLKENKANDVKLGYFSTCSGIKNNEPLFLTKTADKYNVFSVLNDNLNDKKFWKTKPETTNDKRNFIWINASNNSLKTNDDLWPNDSCVENGYKTINWAGLYNKNYYPIYQSPDSVISGGVKADTISFNKIMDHFILASIPYDLESWTQSSEELKTAIEKNIKVRNENGVINTQISLPYYRLSEQISSQNVSLETFKEFFQKSLNKKDLKKTDDENKIIGINDISTEYNNTVKEFFNKYEILDAQVSYLNNDPNDKKLFFMTLASEKQNTAGTKNCILSFKGTINKTDAFLDLELAFPWGSPVPLLKSALTLWLNFDSYARQKKGCAKITYTGHSLGGALAQLASSLSQNPSIVFSGPSVSKALLNVLKVPILSLFWSGGHMPPHYNLLTEQNILNIYIKGDPVVFVAGSNFANVLVMKQLYPFSFLKPANIINNHYGNNIIKSILSKSFLRLDNVPGSGKYPFSPITNDENGKTFGSIEAK